MKLEIFLRTCNRTENNPNMKRILNVSRDDLILGCLRSLIVSLNNVVDIDIQLTILDDSTEDFQNLLFAELKNYKFSYTLENKKLNNNESMLNTYNIAMTRTDIDSVLYFAEDDYLYYPNCFLEMINAYNTFTKNLGDRFVCIHPADSPLEYFPEALQSEYSRSRIVLGRDRHWRTGVSSPFTMLISKRAFIKHFEKFKNYSKFDGINFHEANTINLMFIDDVVLFSPIPTLAFHLGYIYPPAPFCDHVALWNSNKI